jgi:phytoene/squalene synthetase
MLERITRIFQRRGWCRGHMRRHVAAVTVRPMADDFADEGQRSIEERHRLLDGWLCRLRDALPTDRVASRGRRSQASPQTPRRSSRALGATIREKALPPGLFDYLLSAFRQDVTSTRYASWNEVLDYCRRSANPVGRLVLRIGDYRDEQLDGWSDAICTALQLTNFWQDMKIDFDRGRVYLPEEEMRAHGVTANDLAGGAVTPGGKRAPRRWRARGRCLQKDDAV